MIEDKNYFYDVLNQETPMYWAGFIVADGCIRGDRCTIVLAEKDKNHLEKFKSDLKSNTSLIKNISYNSKRNSAWKDSICFEHTIHSEQIVLDLNKIGIYSAKTFTSYFPDEIKNSNNVQHYCRGYFDGDGCFSLHKPTTRKMSPQLVCHIRGTESFLKTFNEILVDKAGLPSRCLDKKINHSSTTGYLMYNGNNITTQIAKWFYKDLNQNSRFMQRKYDLVKHRL